MPLVKIWIFVVCVLLSVGTSPMQFNPLPHNTLIVTAKGLEQDCDYIVLHVFVDRPGVIFEHITVETPNEKNGYSGTVRLVFSGTPAYVTHIELYQYRSGNQLIYGKDKYIPGWWWTGESLPIGDPPPNNVYPGPEYSITTPGRLR